MENLVVVVFLVGLEQTVRMVPQLVAIVDWVIVQALIKQVAAMVVLLVMVFTLQLALEYMLNELIYISYSDF